LLSKSKLYLSPAATSTGRGSVPPILVHETGLPSVTGPLLVKLAPDGATLAIGARAGAEAGRPSEQETGWGEGRVPVAARQCDEVGVAGGGGPSPNVQE